MATIYDPRELPHLPQYSLTPLPFLLAPIPDKLLTLLLPIAAYWILSMFFHWIDEKDYFAKYRLHTPAEVLKRNHVSRYEVVRDVVIQQIVQTGVGWLLGMTEPDDFRGKDEYDVAVWAQRIRIAQHALPGILSVFSVNASGLAQNLAKSYPTLAGAVSGGVYPNLTEMVTFTDGNQVPVPMFASWEMLLAKALYWYLVPAIQFGVAIFVLDTWQYFLHRAMHMNKWMYTTFHSRHHRLYVPYAFGALYNHPFEGFLLDSLGTALAFKGAGMSTRQGMWFFTCSTLKTVDDHCGYVLPWDPLQHLTSNNAGYHDVHHQSWGIKTNFSQPFFTFWDCMLGTVWTGGDVSARYERAKFAAQKKVDIDGLQSSISSITSSSAADNATTELRPYENETSNAMELRHIPAGLQQSGGPTGKVAQQAAGSREQVLEDTRDGGAQILAEEAQEAKEARSMVRKSNRRRTASSLSQSEGLRNLRERVSIHGRTGGILGMESSG